MRTFLVNIFDMGHQKGGQKKMWTFLSYIPAKCLRSAADGGKIAIATQTIKTLLHSAPD
jgi:hypothetical protein